MEYPTERTFSFEERAVVPTTQGFTRATPRAGRIKMNATSVTRGMLLRKGASQGELIDPNTKYAKLKIRYAMESARRKPRRSANAPPPIARNQTQPPNIPVRLLARSTSKCKPSCK